MLVWRLRARFVGHPHFARGACEWRHLPELVPVEPIDGPRERGWVNRVPMTSALGMAVASIPQAIALLAGRLDAGTAQMVGLVSLVFGVAMLGWLLRDDLWEARSHARLARAILAAPERGGGAAGWSRVSGSLRSGTLARVLRVAARQVGAGRERHTVSSVDESISFADVLVLYDGTEIAPRGALWAHASAQVARDEGGAMTARMEAGPGAKVIAAARRVEGSDTLSARGPESLLLFTSPEGQDPAAELAGALRRQRVTVLLPVLGVAVAVARYLLAP